MHTTVTKIHENSPASKTIIKAGDTLRRINGHIICDVLDYRFYSYDSRLLIDLAARNGTIKLVDICKPEGDDLGLEFETPLMDKEQSCRNKCIFCFIDQLPKGMRTSLYHKDDDVRQSLLDGNYVTLTNLSTDDIKRLIKLGISPINVSVHTMNPELRQFMLGKKFDGSNNFNPIEHIKTLAHSGIKLNCQIVCCPGINDGEELRFTIEEMIRLGRTVNSVSVVPVGLTAYRDGLYELETYNITSARKVISIVERYGRMCLKKWGKRIFYCSDEFYMTAKVGIPPNEFYEEYPQLQNGVGMMRLFISEFLRALRNTTYSNKRINNHDIRSTEPTFSVITGELAAPYIKKLIGIAIEKCDKIEHAKKMSRCKIFTIKNNYFGGNVTISGLLTGKDIIEQIKDKKLGKCLLLPKNMLRHNDDVLLDDITISQMSEKLNIPIRVIEVNGFDFLKALLEASDG